MKNLSDYKNDEAIELWADLLDPLSEILTDEKIRTVVQSNKNRLEIAKTILKEHPQETNDILLRIDPTPIDGLNIVLRLVSVITDIGKNEEIKGFFGYAEQAKKADGSGGSAMESTEADET